MPVFLKNGNILVKKLHNLADGKPFKVFPTVALTALDNVTGECLLSLYIILLRSQSTIGMIDESSPAVIQIFDFFLLWFVYFPNGWYPKVQKA